MLVDTSNPENITYVFSYHDVFLKIIHTIPTFIISNPIYLLPLLIDEAVFIIFASLLVFISFPLSSISPPSPQNSDYTCFRQLPPSIPLSFSNKAPSISVGYHGHIQINMPLRMLPVPPPLSALQMTLLCSTSGRLSQAHHQTPQLPAILQLGFHPCYYLCCTHKLWPRGAWFSPHSKSLSLKQFSSFCCCTDLKQYGEWITVDVFCSVLLQSQVF